MPRIFLIAALLLLQTSSFSQNIEKISFNANDKADYYLAIRPQSKSIKGTIVLFTSFWPPEALLTETKLHNTAYANELLMTVVPMQQKLYADSFAVKRINNVLAHIASRFAVDTAAFVLAGFDEAGNIALRYTELAYERPADFTIQPKALFAVSTPVDLFGLWHWSENQIKKNYWPGAVGDAKFYLDAMTKENGTIYNNADKYKLLTPFYKESDAAGNEQYLKTVPVRLYYDMDLDWQLQNRRNSLYDTKIPDASELIKRLMLSGNNKAALVAGKPGMNSNGARNPNSLSIVDEVECIQWIRQCLHIFDVRTWQPPYELIIPANWGVEKFSLPPDFASAISYKGVEDVRFAPGWGEIKSEEHWSYSFLWWLDGNPVVNAEGLQSALKDYYDGLVGRNIIERNIPSAKVVPTHVSVKKIKTAAGDIETFSGTISMLDYHTQLPIVLNSMMHVKDSKTKDHAAIYFEMSPKVLSHPVWQKMNEIGDGFRAK
ncbi:MAG: hypothetical protein QM802_10095 [Agriterribacter sp.]